MGIKGFNKSIQQGLLFGMGATVVNSLMQLIVLAVMARFLSPTEFGLISVGNIITALSMLVLEMGVASAVTQRKLINNEHKGSAHMAAIVMSSLVALCIVVLAKPIADFFDASYFERLAPLYAAIFLVRGLSLVPQGMLYRELKFKTVNFSEVLSFVFGYALFGITAVFNGFGIWSMLMAYFGQSMIKTLVINIKCEDRKEWKASKQGITDIAAFGFGDTFGQLANYLANQLDNILIGKFLGVAVLGVYGRAYQITIMPVNLVGAVLQKTLFPVFSRANKLELTALVMPWLKRALFIGTYISLSIFLWSEEIVLIMLGKNWIQYGGIVEILACGIVFRLMMKFADAILRSQGKLYRRGFVQIIYAAGVLIAVLSSYNQGLEAVCKAILIVVIVVGLINFLTAWHSVNLDYLSLVYSTIAIFMAVIVVAVSHYTVSYLSFNSEWVALIFYSVISLILVAWLGLVESKKLLLARLR